MRRSLPVEVLDESLVESGQQVVEGPLVNAVQTDQVASGKGLQRKELKTLTAELDRESLIRVGVIALFFFIHVWWHPRFPFTGIKKYLT